MTDLPDSNKDDVQRNNALTSAAFNFAELSKLGFYPHLEGTEIEAKLDILEEECSLDQVVEEMKKSLAAQGCTFLEPTDILHNHTLFYTEPKEARGKIIIRNGGADGYQVKMKSPRDKQRDHVLVKKEEKSDNFATLDEARDYLASHIGVPVDELGNFLESKMQTDKYKLTLLAKWSDGVTRVFRLVADESVRSESSVAPAPKLRQVELEYKGSDRQEEDSLESIEHQMLELVSAIISDVHLDLRLSTQSKRNWARK